MSYAMFIALFAVASFCSYRIGRLATLSECQRLLRQRALEHREALSLAVIKASRRGFVLARDASPSTNKAE